MQPLGKNVLEIPPKQGSARNGEGAFLKLRDGRLLFIYTIQTESVHDVTPSKIAARTSSDGGITWTDNDRILFHYRDFDTPGQPCLNISSVSLMRMQDDTIGLYFIIRRSFTEDCRLRLFRSYDEGETFDEGTLCVPSPGYFVTNNDRVIRLSTGRILVPANFHRMKDRVDLNDRNLEFFDQRGIACFLISDDDGKSWREAKDCCFMPSSGSAFGLQETGVVELKKGVLWAFARTGQGSQYFFYSFDGGETWTTPQPSQFTSPLSSMSVKRAPTGGLLAVWNPIPRYQTRDTTACHHYRNPLVGAVSLNDGRTWSKPYVIEDAPGGYCYTAIHFEGDYVLLAYCAGTVGDGSILSRLRIKQILLSDLGL